MKWKIVQRCNMIDQRTGRQAFGVNQHNVVIKSFDTYIVAWIYKWW